MTADSPVRSVAVVGGGCTGLAAAHRLQELAPDIGVTLFEAGPRLGGALQTERSDGYLIEYGADMFTTKEPWARDLCRRIGFEQELIGTNTEHARAFVIRRGKLYPVPEGFALMTPGKAWPILRTPLLGIGGKLRMGWEYFVPARKEVSDESLAEFAIRRLGREAYERLVQPLIAGIYTADPTQLSMQAALPQFVEMERQHGGLLRALRRHRGPRGSAPSAAGARYGLFLAPRHGMQSLMERLAGTLTTTTFRIKTPVVSLDRHDDGSWGVGSANSPPQRFDAVILTSPAYRSADLVEKVDAELAAELRAIPYASSSLVILGYRRDQLRHPLDGFGLVAPHCEGRRILAASFASVKFPERAPADRVLIRVFIGGALQPELARLSDDELDALAQEELAELLGASGAPELRRIVRWERAMPQYHVGHLDRVRRIEQRLNAFPRLALAGNAFRGVGIPHCIHSGEQAAERLLRSRSAQPR